MQPFSTFRSAHHNHQSCVAAILADAEDLCHDRKVRFTAKRRRVLEVVAESHAAIGAYEIMERLPHEGRRPAPITVYRALDFLIEQGLVHRLASLNAYVSCPRPGAAHGAQFLICRHCGVIGELTDPAVDRAIAGAATEVGFEVASPVIEIAGVCVNCRGDTDRGAAV